MLNVNRTPVPKGTRIEYCEMTGIVVEDDGGERIVVDCEGSVQRWWWTFEGVSCKLVPEVANQNS